MMMNTNQNKDLSHINNLEDLRKEIVRVKAEIKTQEQQLEDRAKRLPAEALKASARSVFPFVINNMVAARTFGIVRNVTGLFLGRSKSETTTGQKVINAAKQIGIVTAIKAGLNLFRKRRKKHSDKKEKK